MTRRDVDEQLADALLGLDSVVAVFLGGSRATGVADLRSDTDLYAVHRAAVATGAARAAVLAPLADRSEVHEETAWGPEDHLYVDGDLVEVVHLGLEGLRDLVDRAYAEGLDDEGFATAFLHTVSSGLVLRDPEGEVTALQQRLATYPEATRDLLLASLPPLLTAYLSQLGTAMARGDLLMVQHRRASIQAVWFNLLFALNRVYHPGEKRLLDHAERCALKPDHQRERWMRACRLPADDPDLHAGLVTLVADLTGLVDAEASVA